MTDERLLDDEAVALFASVHELCQTGVVRDRDWWAHEAGRLASDWPGIHHLRVKILEELNAVAMERSTAWSFKRAA